MGQAFSLEDNPHTKHSNKPHRVLLASLALVSKTFNWPATKALWSQLDSFNPLLRLFASLEGCSPNAEDELCVATNVSYYATWTVVP